MQANMKQLLLLVGFEWRYHTRQNGFRFAVLCFAALGAFVHGRLGGSANVNLNAPYLIGYALSLLSLLSVFAAMVFCASAMLRDTDHRMAELVCATPVAKHTVLLGRFGGAFGATLTAVCALALGMFCATFLPLDADQTLGPRVPGHYLLALAIIVVPNVALVSSLLFTVAAFTRNMIATYTGAVLLYALYWTCAVIGGSPMLAQASPPTAEGMALAALLDPFGISAVMQQGMFWNAAEKNIQLVSLSGALLANRLLVIGFTVVMLTLAYRRFRFTPAPAAPGKAPAPGPANANAAPAPRYAPVPVHPSQRQVLLARTRLELGVVLKGWPFIAMMLTWAFLVASALLEGIDNADGGARALAHTSLLLRQFQFQMLPMFGTLLIIFYSGELAWRERALRVDSLLDCTPASSVAFFAAKLLALACLPLLMITLAIVCSLAFQLVMGYPVSEPVLYLSLFYYAGLPLVLTAILALFFQALVPNKYLAMLLTGACTLAAADIGASLGIEHPMLRFARAPQLVYSEMNGYGDSAIAFHWYMGYWSALAALLALASLALWSRGHQRRRLRRTALPGVGARVAATACALLFAGTGGYIYTQANGNGAYASTEARTRWMAEYEQRYSRYRDLPQARVESVRSDVALYPAAGHFTIKGEYKLRNRTSQPIAQLLVASSRHASTRGMALDGARIASRDERFGQTLYQFEPALQPGQQTTLRFEVEDRQSPFSEVPASMSVGANASVLFAPGLLPSIGYLPRFELDNAVERARFGLAPQPGTTRLESEIAAGEAKLRAGEDWRTFDTVISTEAGQTAFAPGRLLKSWDSGARRHFHYRTDGPVRDVAGFFSGRYRSSQAQHGRVKVEIYHHPGHDANVASMRAAALASLDYYQAHFGPYQHDHLRIIEVPASAGLTGFAMPGLILIGEQGGFTADLRAPRSRSQVTRRIAHEVAHQWWGHQVAPAQVEGSLVLVETLTKYAEMRVLEKVHGSAALREQVDYELSRYLIGSANEEGRELPLYRTAPQQSYLMYSKGAVVMHGLTESLGAGNIDAALRDLLAEHAYPGTPATTVDLITALSRRAPAQQALIEESFRQIARYDLKAGPARYQRMEDGRYRVTIQLRARKDRIDELTGLASEGRLDVPLQVGVYDRDASDEHARTLYLGAHRLGVGQSEVSVIVWQEPGMVAVEPTVRLVELDRRDNFAVPAAGPD